MTRTVAMLTAGGLAPCLSAAVGGLIERYTEIAPDARIIAYRDGYAGLLTGRITEVTPEVRSNAGLLRHFGGSPIGNSRVKLTNVADCVRRGLVAEGDDPLRVAAEQLRRDGVTILHTIGGDDTNTAAADLAAYLRSHDYHLTVVGLPKTIDNDVVPIRQTLGAFTAAEQGSIYARNVTAEHSSNPRMLILHEVMGRNCGWLAASTANAHHDWVKSQEFLPAIGLDQRKWDVHAVYLPEMRIDVDAEIARLAPLMDELDNVNIFFSEGAGAAEVVAAMRAAGEEVPVDPFGHVKLDKVNPGAYFVARFAAGLRAEKNMVQKSGYFSRSAAANGWDLSLIQRSVEMAVQCGLDGVSGVVGEDVERAHELRAIEFERIRGGRQFDVTEPWFQRLLTEIGQPTY